MFVVVDAGLAQVLYAPLQDAMQRVFRKLRLQSLPAEHARLDAELERLQTAFGVERPHGDTEDLQLVLYLRTVLSLILQQFSRQYPQLLPAIPRSVSADAYALQRSAPASEWDHLGQALQVFLQQLDSMPLPTVDALRAQIKMLNRAQYREFMFIQSLVEAVLPQLKDMPIVHRVVGDGEESPLIPEVNAVAPIFLWHRVQLGSLIYLIAIGVIVSVILMNTNKLNAGVHISAHDSLFGDCDKQGHCPLSGWRIVLVIVVCIMFLFGTCFAFPKLTNAYANRCDHIIDQKDKLWARFATSASNCLGGGDSPA